jgi:hypothetical protein
LPRTPRSGSRRHELPGTVHGGVDDDPLARRQLRAQPLPRLVRVARARTDLADQRLELANGELRGALDPSRLRLAPRDRQHGFGGSQANGSRPQRLTKDRP